MGDDCSLCVPGYYANSSLLPIDTNYCIGNSSHVEIIKWCINGLFVCFPFLACNCDEGGVIDDGRCDNNGTCSCKVGTDPPKCSMCASGYWNFSLTNSNGCQG